jgi:tripartite-type tricarboxylate transporter receptor subunit TctC
LPDVPTFGEIGVANYELRIWTGILTPAGTPREIVVKLNKTIQLLLQSAALRKEIANEGGEAGAMTPRQFEGFLRSERERWQGLVTESGVPKVL